MLTPKMCTFPDVPQASDAMRRAGTLLAAGLRNIIAGYLQTSSGAARLAQKASTGPTRGREHLRRFDGLPRPELGFVKAGEVRGDRISFTIGKDAVSLESPGAIAPEDAAYTLYVLHDSSWEPTVANPARFLLLGSVSARELAALTAK